MTKDIHLLRPSALVPLDFEAWDTMPDNPYHQNARHGISFTCDARRGTREFPGYLSQSINDAVAKGR